VESYCISRVLASIESFQGSCVRYIPNTLFLSCEQWNFVWGSFFVCLLGRVVTLREAMAQVENPSTEKRYEKNDNILTIMRICNIIVVHVAD
jgi:hypothetical protein